MGAYLANHRLRRGELTWLAEQLGVSTRTLGNWRARARRAGPVRPAHRPRASEPSSEVHARVVELWKPLVAGHDGSKTLSSVAQREGIELPVRWTQRLVAELKRERAKQERERIDAARVSQHVQARDALWSCDESFLGRDEHGEARGLLVRECCTPTALWLSIGPPATASELVGALQSAAAERGAWPLVIAFDNGAANRSGEVARLLEEQRVVALFNLPRTPQHNPFVEREWGDLKRAARLEHVLDGVPRASYVDGGAWRAALFERLEAARVALQRTPRARLGGSTPDEIDERAPRAEDLTCRARFHHEVCAALARIADLPLKRRARRLAEREAIFHALEEHGLLYRTRGNGRLSRPSKRKGLV